jgi:transposase-like protein
MGTHRKTWIKSEKLAALNMAKAEGFVKASLHYQVSQTSLYKWRDKLETVGETGLEKNNQSELRRENKKLMDENLQLKQIIAEKELRLRIQEAVLKKSHNH